MFEFKQKVWCVMFGAGVVRNILATDTRFPLVVEFDGKLECYTLDGKYVLNTAQALFPHPVEVIERATKPTINWDHVNSRYKYLAQDESGTCWVYENVPILIEDEWASSRGDCTPADCLQSLVPGTCDWKDSLIERPTGNSGDD